MHDYRGGGGELEGSELVFWEEEIHVPRLLVCERAVGVDSGHGFFFTFCHPLGDEGAGAGSGRKKAEICRGRHEVC